VEFQIQVFRHPAVRIQTAARLTSCTKAGGVMNALRFDPQGPFKRDPLPPHQMRDRLTRTQDVFLQCHLGVPRIERRRWLLTIDGMVERPRTLRFDDLVRYSKIEVASVHQCCGSPLAPFEPTRRVCNVTWGGVRLADVLADCRPSPAARYVCSYGADFGEFSGIVVDAYAKDLPIARVEAGALIAYEMNGNALPAENGFPARLVVPGFYGTNSVKWLTRMTVSESRAPGPFTTRWYNDPVLDGSGGETGETTPVWSIVPESLIVSPMPHETIELSGEREIWGWAWADGGVRNVYIRTDDAAAWRRAELEPLRGPEWQRFSMRWTPRQRGSVVLASLAEAQSGLLQPILGRRNAIHDVMVNVI
jgi:DMSO/TMAO reductase YedYZ molybdopterin-dependent catalytic subunit